MLFYSILPPIAAILGAAVTKRIIPSLLFGLLIGTFLKSGTLLGSVLYAGETLAKVVADEGHAYIILFLFGFGALADIFKLGGGISGFAKVTESYVKTERGALLSVLLATPLTFLDCCFHVISTGTISRPLLEKVQGSKEKLAFIINTTSSQLIVLIPFATTYVGYILGVIRTSAAQAGIDVNPYPVYLASIPFNFYSLIILTLSILTIFFNLNFSFLNIPHPSYKYIEEGEHNSHEAHGESSFNEKAKPNVWNLLLPLFFLFSFVVYLFWFTGQPEHYQVSFWDAILNAKYEKAFLVATLSTLLFTAILYMLQKISMKEIQTHFFSGGVEMLPPVVILILAWSITNVTQDLGFNAFMQSFFATTLPVQYVPLIIFIFGGLVSYFMGSSWGTWALVMPIAITLAVTTGANIPLIVGAVLAGGSIGDNLSPLGETPVLTAAVTEMPVTAHVNYILPYGLAAAAMSAVLYLVVGYLF